MSSAVSITAASTVCAHGADRPVRTPPGRRAGRRARWSSRRTWPIRRPGRRAAGPAPRGGSPRRLGCGSGWPNRAHGYLSTAARTAAVRSSPVPPGPCRSIVVTMRKLCALPSNPSGSPSRTRAIRSSTCSPRCPNGGCPRSWASAAASTTSTSQPPRACTVAAVRRVGADPLRDGPGHLGHLQAVREPVVHDQPGPGGAHHLGDPGQPGEERATRRSGRGPPGTGCSARPAPVSSTPGRRAARRA